MGAWGDNGVVWLPWSRYPKRGDAIGWAVAEWEVHWTDARCLSRQMVQRPRGGEDFWAECEPDTPGAFRAWRLEQA